MGLLDTRAGFAVVTSVVLLFGFFVRVWQLGASDLWVDEAISYYIANLSPIEIIRYTAQNIYEHPPGYYFALHFWMRLAGSSELTLRFFSVLGGMLYLALLIMLVRRWFDRRLALLVGALFCVQPLAVTLSRDTRMYPWYGVGILLVIYLFDRAIHQRGVLAWLLFTLAALFAISVEYLSVYVLLALAIFAIINWRTLGRRALPFALILLLLLGAPLIWIATSPGPRGSMLLLLDALKVPWSPARFFWLYFGWPLSGAADDGQTLGLWLLAGLRWLLAAVGIVWAVQPRIWPRRAFQWLLALLIVVPPFAASLVFSTIKQRFFFGTVGIFVLAIALGIVACWRRFRPFGAALAAVLVLALLLMDGKATFPPLKGEWRSFSVPVRHILARAREGEPIVYTYPWDRYQDSYYNGGRQPAYFVPSEESPVTVADAAVRALDALDRVGSAWLISYPSLLKPELVERGFNRVGYPGEKVWFSGSRGVVRYFAERPLSEQPGGMVWADDIKLNRWWSSSSQVAAGDALRFQFEWQNNKPGGANESSDKEARSDLVELTLVGADGQSWATRVAAPCNGLCGESGWGDQPAQERAAFYIPSDTPPGRYEVRLRRLTSTGEPMLVSRPDSSSPQAFVRLLDAEILPPDNAGAAEAPLARTFETRTSDGKLTLVSLTPPAASTLTGGMLTVPMQWRVEAPLGALEARMVLTRNGQAPVVIARPLGPTWYSSDAWTPGHLVRTRESFAVPGTLEPGAYTATIEIGLPNSAESTLRLPVGALTVQDRERRFELPAEGEPVAVDWQEGIHLARVSVPAEIKAGETMSVTLAWQAGRPTGGNWKVFLHLVDSQGVVRGQGDAYPLGGGALTPTWKPREVILDTHQIELPKDLAPGDYRLHIGFYNESTNERLPLADGADTYAWPQPISVVQR